MILIVLTVVVIALLVAVLAIFLFVLGVLLNRTANNLDDCVQNVENIAKQAKVIGPGVARINETGKTVVGALPLLCDAAEQIGVAKSAPYVDPSDDSYSTPSTVTSGAPSSAPSAVTAGASHSAPSVVPAASPVSVGYLDKDGGSVGYLDT